MQREVHEVILHNLVLLKKRNSKDGKLVSKYKPEQFAAELNQGMLLQRFTLVAKKIGSRLYSYGLAICSTDDNFSRKSGVKRAYISAEESPIAFVKTSTKDNLKEVIEMGKTISETISKRFNDYKKFQECARTRVNFPNMEEFILHFDLGGGYRPRNASR